MSAFSNTIVCLRLICFVIKQSTSKNKMYKIMSKNKIKIQKKNLFEVKKNNRFQISTDDLVIYNAFTNTRI